MQLESRNKKPKMNKHSVTFHFLKGVLSALAQTLFSTAHPHNAACHQCGTLKEHKCVEDFFLFSLLKKNILAAYLKA